MNINLNEQNQFNPFQLSKKDHQQMLFDNKEAFMLGNLFKDLYMSYNGFSNYYFQPLNERQSLLAKFQMYQFIAHEINLFLDTHPQNQMMLDLYCEYSTKTKEALAQFEEMEGPLLVLNSSSKNPFEWVKGPWPWEHQ